MKMSKAVGGVVLVAGSVAWSGSALAEESGSSFSIGASAEANEEGASADATSESDTQEADAEPVERPEPSTGGTSYATEPQAAAADAPPPGGTDHSRFVGSFGIGYMGYRSMGISAFGAQPLEAPVIGVRYWMDPGLGFDVGLGISKSTGSTEFDPGGGGMTVETDAPGPLVAILHAGLPLALADSQHFVFQVVPELNIGYATHTIEDAGENEDSFTALHLDVGARAGAEIHFGFIGIPQLALQAGVGLSVTFDSTSTEDDLGMTTSTTDTSRTGISTGVGDNPWNIFAANVAALYYFDQ